MKDWKTFMDWQTWLRFNPNLEPEQARTQYLKEQTSFQIQQQMNMNMSLHGSTNGIGGPSAGNSAAGGFQPNMYLQDENGDPILTENGSPIPLDP